MPAPRPGRQRGGVAAAVTGAAIAAEALSDVGHPYVWGAWDCSGAVNHWLSQLGLPIPGYAPGAFRGPPPHGPVVLDYASWDGAVTIAGPPQAGDLCVWTGGSAGGHIGIAIGPGQMVSALDPAQGTEVTPIAGTGPDGPFMYRRPLAYAGGGSISLYGGAADGLAASGARLALIVLLLAAGAGALAITAGVIVAAGGITGIVLKNRHRTRADF